MFSNIGKLICPIFLAALSACSAASGGHPSLAVSPGTMAFGEQSVNTARQQTVTVTNTGQNGLQIDNISLNSSGGFGLTSSPGRISLEAGHSVQLVVSFKPTAPISYSGTLDVISPSTSASVALTGTGTLSAVSVSISPADASVQVAESQQFTALVSNASDTRVTWLVNGTVGGNSSVGTISSSGLYTAPRSVPSPASLTVTAQSVADTSKSASAIVTVSSPPISVSVSPTGATCQVGHSQQFTATVSNTSNTAVTWLVNGSVGGDSALGTISSTGLYTAPSSVPSPASVTVTAQSVADTSKSASTNVSITAALAISVSLSPTSTSIQVGHSQQFTATVSNTSNTAVTWLVNGTVGGNSTLGTISSTGLYTAPSSVPSPAGVTVTAQSVADTSKSASANVSVANTTAGQYYVAPTGSDANNGSAASPWATIAHAATVIGPGATVHVGPGAYTGYITTSVSGTASSRITYISDLQWGAKIIGDRVDHSTWHNYGDYVDIVGFELTSVGRMGLYNDGSFVRYISNHVHDIAGPTSATCDLGGAGIMHGNYAASDDEMIGNFVHDIGLVNSAQCPGYVTVHGLYHANLRGQIVNNLVINARDYGIHLYHSATAVIVANNTSLKNGASGLVVGNSNGGSDNNTVVTNNIFAYNNDYGFRDDSGTTGPNNKYDNNLTFNNGDGNYVASGGAVSGNISSDPQFVNYTGTALGNYQLRATSSAIDAGTTLNAPSIDFDGGARPVGKGNDIGCYEYGSAPGTWPWY